uniref:Ionotropic receptor IR12 n=1 Tax=Lobesia botrana TaxID=209534 RepID=A0A345BF19_9NEOP|nr:ionotropic receptor IR12 [Lobesia botrana]
MDLFKLVTLSWLLIIQAEGKNVDKFLKGFVENERKPTVVVFNGVCWKNSLKVHLMKELFKIGVRSSSRMPKTTSLQDHTVMLLTDLDCPRTAEVFQNATHQELHRLPYRWLALSRAPVSSSSPLWDRFLVDSDMVVAAEEGDGYRMTEIHKPALNWPTIVTPRGEFHGTFNDARPHREHFRRRRDVMGATITMVNAIQQHNSSIDRILQDDRRGLEYDVMARNGWTYGKLGFYMLNATPKAEFAYSFGYVKNGQWTGVIQSMIDYKGDIGTNLGMNKARLAVVTYIDTMDNSKARFIYRQPALSRTANIFSLPFSSGVWMATGIACFFAGFAFYVSMNWPRRDGFDRVRVGDTFLLATSALSQQGCELQPHNLSARIVLWSVFTSMMALYAAYSANIVVLLQAPSTSINSLAQLVKAKITLAGFDVDYNRFLFKADPDPLRDHIAKQVKSNKFYTLSEGTEKIRKGLFAFHSLVEPVYRQIEKTFQEAEKCDLMELDYIGYSGHTSPASRKSPYVELLRVTYRWLREVGLRSVINHRFESPKPSCKQTVAMFSSVGVAQLRPVLLFMVYGVLLSIAVAVLELIYYHANRNFLRRRRFAETLDY